MTQHIFYLEDGGGRVFAVFSDQEVAEHAARAIKEAGWSSNYHVRKVEYHITRKGFDAWLEERVRANTLSRLNAFEKRALGLDREGQ